MPFASLSLLGPVRPEIRNVCQMNLMGMEPVDDEYLLMPLLGNCTPHSLFPIPHARCPKRVHLSMKQEDKKKLDS